jgi:hypothetical protein
VTWRIPTFSSAKKPLKFDVIQGPDWRDRVRTVKTCAELTSFVTELLTKGVDWTRARQLFPISNGRSGMRLG